MIRNGLEQSMRRSRLTKLTRLRKHLDQLNHNWSMHEPELMEYIDIQITSLEDELKQYEARAHLIESNPESDVFSFLSTLEETGSSLIKGRLSLSWTQADLARKAHLDSGNLSRYENNGYAKVSLEVALRIAQTLVNENRRRQERSRELDVRFADRTVRGTD